MEGDTDESALNRRRVIQSLGAIGLTGLAGCGSGGNGNGGGDGGGDGGDGGDGGGNGNGGGDGGDGGATQGERVPRIVMEYLAGARATPFMEDMMPIVQQNLEGLGLVAEIRPTELSTQLSNMFNDARTQNFGLLAWTPTPDRLDPTDLTRRHSADRAGEGAGGNPNNYANCEYTEAAIAQAEAPDTQTRQDLVNRAHQIMSEDIGSIPLVPLLNLSAARTDAVDADGIGVQGVSQFNPNFFVKSSAIGRDSINMSTQSTFLETRNFPTTSLVSNLAMWSNFVHSPLVQYNENFDLENILAETVTFENNGRRLVVELRDATFHNGDPVTAEDVRFTFNHLQDNADVYTLVQDLPIDTIDTPDDATVVFEMSQPFPPMLTQQFPRWGILHRDTWVEGGAPDDPEGFQFDPAIGSGPFRLTQFQNGQLMTLEPFDDHPLQTPQFSLNLVGFQDQQPMFNAFRANEVQLMENVSLNNADQLEEEDYAEVYSAQGHTGFTLYPQYPFGPTKFREFRLAAAVAINRDEISQVAMRGRAEPERYSCPLLPAHPWRPPEDMLTEMGSTTAGDTEAARQILEDAGWTWDNNGNLRFPADADLSPRWPQGETPSPDDYPCLG